MLYTEIVLMGEKDVSVKNVVDLQFANINGLNKIVKIVVDLQFASMGEKYNIVSNVTDIQFVNTRNRREPVKIVHQKNAFYANELFRKVVSNVTVEQKCIWKISKFSVENLKSLLTKRMKWSTKPWLAKKKKKLESVDSFLLN